MLMNVIVHGAHFHRLKVQFFQVDFVPKRQIRHIRTKDSYTVHNVRYNSIISNDDESVGVLTVVFTTRHCVPRLGRLDVEQSSRSGA